MSVVENIIYGLISGITEFFPVSSRAHQTLLQFMFGVESRNYLQEFLVHIGILISALFVYRDYIKQLSREQKSLQFRNRRKTDFVLYYDLKLLKTATVSLLICLCFFLIFLKNQGGLLSVSAFLIINAIICAAACSF